MRNIGGAHAMCLGKSNNNAKIPHAKAITMAAMIRLACDRYVDTHSVAKIIHFL